MPATPKSTYSTYQGKKTDSEEKKPRFKEMLKNQDKKKLHRKHFVSSLCHWILLRTSWLNVRQGPAGSLLQLSGEKPQEKSGENKALCTNTLVA